MASRCVKHTFDFAVAQCSACHEPFCADCVVYPRGESKPPTCVPCALVAAGVRRLSAAEKKAIKANRGKKVDIAPPGTELPGRMVVGAEEPEPVPAFETAGYDSPMQRDGDPWSPESSLDHGRSSRPLHDAAADDGDEEPAGVFADRERVGVFVGGGSTPDAGDGAGSNGGGRRFGRFGRR